MFVKPRMTYDSCMSLWLYSGIHQIPRPYTVHGQKNIDDVLRKETLRARRIRMMCTELLEVTLFNLIPPSLHSVHGSVSDIRRYYTSRFEGNSIVVRAKTRTRMADDYIATKLYRMGVQDMRYLRCKCQ